MRARVLAARRDATVRLQSPLSDFPSSLILYPLSGTGFLLATAVGLVGGFAVRTGGNFFRCVLSAMFFTALSAPGSAEPALYATTRPLEVQASDESPQAAAARRVEAMFRRQERGIRQAINDRQFQLARERVETARRMVESACRGLQSPEPRRGPMLELDSLARFIGSEERLSAARQSRGVPQAGPRLNRGEPGGPPPGVHRPEDPSINSGQDGPARPTDVRRTRDRLREVIPMVHFPEGTSFEDVLNWLRQRSGLSIDVNWRALAELGIDRNTDTLGLTLTTTPSTASCGSAPARIWTATASPASTT